jgi:hypothetical protein
MPIQSVADMNSAYAAGRVHTQRFIKTAAGLAGDGQWQDWAYTGGQPAFDARIGVTAEFTPFVATRNDAIWFPSIASDQHRHLAGLRWYSTAGGAGQLSVEVQMYDLLGVYPLLDGDSTDTQTMDNTQPLPRYADGVGVQMVLVNHISPGTVAADCTITYVDSFGSTKTTAFGTSLAGLGKAAFGETILASSGSLYVPLSSASRGVVSVTDITFSAPPGGLWAIYLVRPIAHISNRGGSAGQTTVMTQKCFCHEDAFMLPRIYDGAHLGFFYMPNGGARTVATIYGTATFIWN